MTKKLPSLKHKIKNNNKNKKAVKTSLSKEKTPTTPQMEVPVATVKG